MNKYLVILVCVMCAVSTGWAKKKKSHKAVQEPEAVEQVEETVAEEPAEEPAAVEASEETAVEAPAVEAPAEESAEETAEDAAPAEEVAADATETDEVAEASEEAVDESEEVSEDDEDEAVTKSKKKKKKKKKKSKKKKKKKHSDDDEDEYMGGPKIGAHVVLSPVFTDWNNYGVNFNLGFAFAYYFNSNMAVRTGLDIGVGYTMGKVLVNNGPGYYPSSYEYNYSDVMISLQLPVYFRYAINDMFWAEAGVVAGGNVYSYSHKSSDFGSESAYGQVGKGNFDSAAGLYNTTLGGGVNLGPVEIGLQVGVSNWSTFACNVGLTLGMFF